MSSKFYRFRLEDDHDWRYRVSPRLNSSDTGLPPRAIGFRSPVGEIFRPGEPNFDIARSLGQCLPAYDGFGPYPHS